MPAETSSLADRVSVDQVAVQRLRRGSNGEPDAAPRTRTAAPKQHGPGPVALTWSETDALVEDGIIRHHVDS